MADDKGSGHNPVDDLKLLLLFFIILWLFWFVSGGPARYELAQKPFLRPPVTTDFSQNNMWRDPNIGEQYGSIPSIKIRKVVRIVPRKQSVIRPTILLSKGLADSSGKSFLKMEFSILNNASLNITGLTVRGLLGDGFVVPGASSLPYQGRINEETDILLIPGSVVYLIEHKSPTGVSFRINKCMGRLADFQTFYPPLPDYKYGKLNYNSCVENYKNDSDFYLNDWRVYIGIDKKTWSETGDFVKIIDNSGNTLSSIFY